MHVASAHNQISIHTIMQFISNSYNSEFILAVISLGQLSESSCLPHVATCSLMEKDQDRGYN